MPTIQVNDINLYYEQHGHGEDLVLICGFANNLTRWQHIIDELSKKYRVLAFDNRGSGRSDTPTKPFSIETMARDTAALMEALSIDNAYILGHSMGSSILQHLCLTHKKKVRKAILLSSFPSLLTTCILQLEATGELFQAQIPIPLLLKTLLPWFWGATFLSNSENIETALNHYLTDPHLQTLEGFNAQFGALKPFNLTSRLNEISVPTLLITGDEDIYTPPKQAEFLQSHIPNSTLIILPETGHMVPQENPKGLLELVYSCFTS